MISGSKIVRRPAAWSISLARPSCCLGTSVMNCCGEMSGRISFETDSGSARAGLGRRRRYCFGLVGGGGGGSGRFLSGLVEHFSRGVFFGDDARIIGVILGDFFVVGGVAVLIRLALFSVGANEWIFFMYRFSFESTRARNVTLSMRKLFPDETYLGSFAATTGGSGLQGGDIMAGLFLFKNKQRFLSACFVFPGVATTMSCSPRIVVSSGVCSVLWHMIVMGGWWHRKEYCSQAIIRSSWRSTSYFCGFASSSSSCSASLDPASGGFIGRWEGVSAKSDDQRPVSKLNALTTAIQKFFQTMTKILSTSSSYPEGNVWTRGHLLHHTSVNEKYHMRRAITGLTFHRIFSS